MVPAGTYYILHFAFSLVVVKPTGLVTTDDENGLGHEAAACHQPSFDANNMAEKNVHYRLGKSDIEALPGHWPSSYCKITNMFLKSSERRFYVGIEDASALEVCFGTGSIWSLAPKESALAVPFHCDQIYELGHVFTLYYYHGCNYFHLHYDTVLPLFHSLWQRSHSYTPTSKNTVLMPSVEIERGKGINWKTDAFFNKSAYWNTLLQTIASSYQVLPLDDRLRAMDKTLCFKEILFGTPKINIMDKNAIHSYVSFMKSKLNIQSKRSEYPKRLGLIHRTGRRKMLNIYQLREVLKSFINVDIIDFANLSLRSQIDTIQKYDILAGMNGAGLMNAIYLPEKSVVIQMVPFEAQLNHVEYRKILQARGPYLEWHNTHAELNRRQHKEQLNNPDTIVEVDEFVALIKQALHLLK